HHVLDDILILASQATKLAQLFVDTRNAAVEYRPRARSQGTNFGARRRPDDVPLRGNQLFRQRQLEQGQAAFGQERIVTIDLGQERLLRGHRKNLRRWDSKQLCAAAHLAGDFGKLITAWRQHGISTAASSVADTGASTSPSS